MAISIKQQIQAANKNLAALFKAAVLRKIDLNEFKSPSKFKKSFPKEKRLKVQTDLFNM